MTTLTKTFLLFLPFFLFPNLSLSQPPPSPVSVSPVIEKEVKKPLKLVGATLPAKRSVISSEVEGIVGKINAEEGKFVKKGEILAEIRNDKLLLALQQLKNEKKEALAMSELSEKDFARIKELYGKGIVSDGEFDRAKTERESKQSGLLSLESRIRIAEYDLAASKIQAPFNGYVTKQHVEVGQWLDIGGQVVSLVNIDTIEVTAGLPERYIETVSEGMEVSVVLSSLNRRTVPGKISSIIPDADPRAISFPIKVVLENPDHTIKSLTSALIVLRVGESEKIKLVPKDSIVNSPQGAMVFAVREGVAHPVSVEQKDWYESFVHIEGKINVGESVVVRGNERLRPMQQVRIVDTIEQ